MKLFILGCGFVGSKIAEYYQGQGELVTVTTTSEEKVQELKKIAQQVVLIDPETDLTEVLTHQDAVIVTVAPKSSADYQKAYLETAMRLQKALKGNKHVKTLIYTSSCSVYGEKEGKWVDENQPLEPINEQQKILAETEKTYLNQLPSSIKVCIFRLGEIYGLEKSIQSKVSRLSEMNHPIYGYNFTNFIHVQDVVKAVDFALKTKASGVYNLCNDSHLTRKEFYDKWCKFLKIGPLNFDEKAQSIHRGNKRVSNQKIKLSGFEFDYPLAEPI